jgi:hypothetical protein
MLMVGRRRPTSRTTTSAAPTITPSVASSATSKPASPTITAQPDLRVGDAGSRQSDRKRRREAMEAGLDGEQGDGEPEHAPIIGEAP